MIIIWTLNSYLYCAHKNISHVTSTPCESSIFQMQEEPTYVPTYVLHCYIWAGKKLISCTGCQLKIRVALGCADLRASWCSQGHRLNWRSCINMLLFCSLFVTQGHQIVRCRLLGKKDMWKIQCRNRRLEICSDNKHRQRSKICSKWRLVDVAQPLAMLQSHPDALDWRYA